MTDQVDAPFGYKTLPQSQKIEAVRRVFERVAPSYDLMNDVMSAGIHRVWKDMACNRLNPQPGERILDVAGGTGDIARRLLKLMKKANDRRVARGGSHKPCEVTILDYNEAMINQGIQKSSESLDQNGLNWIVGDATALPFEDQSLDAYVISFGIRNVSPIETALAEARRVLRPGGRFFCLEFSKPSSVTLRELYKSYSFKLIPQFGEWIAKDRDSYQYLVESIDRFPDQEEFASMIIKSGFGAVGYQNYSNGIAALHFGRA
jgi:demethylmenaquinone methyltransferase / 2-methoxy-6-polyprenyl-1,4-benzoquinol methylase